MCSPGIVALHCEIARTRKTAFGNAQDRDVSELLRITCGRWLYTAKLRFAQHRSPTNDCLEQFSLALSFFGIHTNVCREIPITWVERVHTPIPTFRPLSDLRLVDDGNNCFGFKTLALDHVCQQLDHLFLVDKEGVGCCLVVCAFTLKLGKRKCRGRRNGETERQQKRRRMPIIRTETQQDKCRKYRYKNETGLFRAKRRQRQANAQRRWRVHYWTSQPAVKWTFCQG